MLHCGNLSWRTGVGAAAVLLGAFLSATGAPAAEQITLEQKEVLLEHRRFPGSHIFAKLKVTLRPVLTIEDQKLVAVQPGANADIVEDRGPGGFAELDWGIRIQAEADAVLKGIELSLADGQSIAFWRGTVGRGTGVAPSHPVDSKDTANSILKVRLGFFRQTATVEWPVSISPLADLILAFQNVQTMYGATLEVPDLPPDYRDVLAYRLRLLDRFFAFHSILRSGIEIEIGGAVGGKRPLIERDVLFVGAAYLNLLQAAPPTDLAPHIIASWHAADRRLVFEGLREQAAIRKALQESQVIRARVMAQASLEGMVGEVLGTLSGLPGGTLAWSVQTLVTGRNIDGTVAGLTERLFAFADVALQTLPIVQGVLRTSTKLQNLRMKQALSDWISDRAALRQRLAAAGRNTVVKESIMTQWLDDLDRLTGRDGMSLPTGREAVRADGSLGTVQGLDRYVVPREGSTLPATAREYKRIEQFDGQWSRSGVGLNPHARVQIPGIHTSSVPTTQHSWSYIIDRTMKAYRFARRNNMTREMEASLDLLRRFRDGRLTRSVVVMDDSGAVFFAKEADIVRMVDEAPNPATPGSAVTIDVLRAAAGRFVDAPPPN